VKTLGGGLNQNISTMSGTTCSPAFYRLKISAYIRSLKEALKKSLFKGSHGIIELTCYNNLIYDILTNGTKMLASTLHKQNRKQS
jgi:hypothetical protein